MIFKNAWEPWILNLGGIHKPQGGREPVATWKV